MSPGVVRMVGHNASRVSFAESRTLLWELAQVPLSIKQIERTAESLGRQISADEEPNRAATLYLGMDGTGIPMRTTETAGRKGKPKAGDPAPQAKTREVKLATVWSAVRFDDRGVALTDPGSVSYNVAIESAHTGPKALAISAFGKRVEREANRRQFYQAKRQVVIGDGALWIWNTCAELFPDALQIVDLFHAKEKIATVAKTIFGEHSDLVRPWRKLRFAELDRGDLQTLLDALSNHRRASKAVCDANGYFENNRHRMRYGEFRAQRQCVSSGVVEAGCKNAIGARLKRSGMHWSVPGANAILALRCCVLSRRFDDFCTGKTSADD